MYQKGEFVVYGTTGPCLVEDVTNLTIPGCDRKRKYYILHPVNTGKSTIYSPVDNVKVTMRYAIERTEAEALIDNLAEIKPLVVESEKFREEQFKDILKRCDLNECVAMIKLLFKKRRARLEQGRKFTTIDERYLRDAVDMVCSELALACGESREQMTERLASGMHEKVHVH